MNPCWEFSLEKIKIVKKVVNIFTLDKVHSKGLFLEMSSVNGLGEPILSTFSSEKPQGVNFFCEPEKKHFKELYFEYYHKLIGK